MNTIDPVTLEIVNNRLRFISKEMVVALVRTAYSSVIYDGQDCSCALFNAKGELLTLDAGLPAHIGPMPFSVKAVFRKFQEDVNPGDIFIVNDPSYGGNHLPDVLVCMPIFYKEELVFFVAARGHWTDIGGMVPGSLSGEATEIYQEGVVIPPIKLYEADKMNQGVVDLVLSNTRNREERLGDLMSHVASCKSAEKSCLELLEKYGVETVKRCGEEIIHRSEKRLQARLSSIPKGTYSFEDYLDNDGISKRALRIKVTVTIKSDSILVDFTGSSPQSRGPTNAPLSVTYTGTVEGIKIAIDPLGVTNEGLFRVVRVNAPPGSLVNPKPGAATGGCTEVFYRIGFCVVGALAQVLPDSVSGCDYGSVNHSYISGISKETGGYFIHYDFPTGGNGGTSVIDGPSALRSPLSGDVYLPSHELVESLYPVIAKCLNLRVDSGGAGKFRGGLGLVRQIEIVAEAAALSAVTDRNKIPPFGVFQGQSALPQQWTVIRNRTERPISPTGKVRDLKLRKGDIASCRTAGGGGYGDPLDRNPDNVRNDVIEGYVSIKAARDVYGVVLKEDDFSTDIEATQARRKIIRGKRRFFISGGYGTPVFVEGVKAIMLNKEEAATFRTGDLIEIFYPEMAAPYRARVVFRSKVKPGHALVNNETKQMMGIKDGDSIQIINLSSQQQIGI